MTDHTSPEITTPDTSAPGVIVRGTNGQGLATRSVHAGERRDAQGAIHTPLYAHSTFASDSTADLLDVVEGRTGGNLRYGRRSRHLPARRRDRSAE